MAEFNNFKREKPTLAGDIMLWEKHGVSYIFDENGNEWYACQASFATDTLKVVYDQDGIIRSMSKDVSALWPENMSVAELTDDNSSQGIDICGGWKYSNGKVSQIDDHEDSQSGGRRYKEG